MELTVKAIDCRYKFDGDIEVILTVDKGESKAVQQGYYELHEKMPLLAKLARKTRKRSLNANAYLWVLCDKIAAKLQSTKTEVYQDAIREVGVFNDLSMADHAVEGFIALWEKQGIGSYAEISHKDKAGDSRTVVRAYHGSHLYDTEQMSRLVDYVVNEAQGLEIQTMTPDEIAKIKAVWGWKVGT